MNKKLVNFLQLVNDENYENFVDVKSKKELINSMNEYYKNTYDDFNDDFVNSIITWNGAGTYVLAGHNFNCDYICKINNLIDDELNEFNSYNFPFVLNQDAIFNINKFYKDLRRENDCKYIYLVTRYASAENKTYVDDVIYTNDDSLNVNDEYSLEEIGTLSLEDLLNYKFTEIY